MRRRVPQYSGGVGVGHVIAQGNLGHDNRTGGPHDPHRVGNHVQVGHRHEIPELRLNFGMQQAHLGDAPGEVGYRDEIAGPGALDDFHHDARHDVADEGRRRQRDGGTEQDADQAEQLSAGLFGHRQGQNDHKDPREGQRKHDQLEAELRVGIVFPAPLQRPVDQFEAGPNQDDRRKQWQESARGRNEGVQ
jgi:hypothetical protein